MTTIQTILHFVKKKEKKKRQVEIKKIYTIEFKNSRSNRELEKSWVRAVHKQVTTTKHNAADIRTPSLD